MAKLSLANLDNGLYFDNGAWTSDYKFAQSFPDRETMSRVVLQFKVKNAAAALIEGDPPQVRGFFWITEITP